MSVYIVDACVAAKWFFEENHTEKALSLLDTHNRLYAPDFILMEMDNVLCKRIRRREISADEAAEIRSAFQRFPVQYHSFTLLLNPAYEMANLTGSSLYDCLYLALAALMGERMVTADHRLYNGLKNSPFTKYLLWIENV